MDAPVWAPSARASGTSSPKLAPIGTRGVRLGVVKPGLYAMQVRALMEAAAERTRKGGRPVIEVMAS